MKSPRLAIIIEAPGISAAAEGEVLWGWERTFVEAKLRKAGINMDDVVYVSCKDQDACLEHLNSITSLTVLVPMGEIPLQFTTGLKSITKWQLSPLDTLPSFNCRKVIPTFPIRSINKDFALNLYLEMALQRAARELGTSTFTRKPKRFMLNPGLEETFDTLHMLSQLTADDWLSIDIETGQGIINTVGFAWSESDAIAIQVLPSRLCDENFHALWCRIAEVVQGPAKKVMQNGIYETLYFARYGVHVANFAHDTMVAQKFLWPEFDKGLDNVGRFYTNEPYWKDTGRVESEEGKRKDWGDIRDWPRHLAYNCLDTTGTFEGMQAQRRDMTERGSLAFFDNYLMKLHPIMSEMCLRGLPLCSATRDKLVQECESQVAELSAGLSMQFKKGKKQVSALTRAQKMQLLKEKGYKIPTKKNKETGAVGESVDELSLKMILQKHPEDTDIPKLLKIAELEKALSSYFKVAVDPFDAQVHFSMDIHGTETGRWSSNTDPWGRGLNAQTLPKFAKKMLKWGTHE